MFTGIVQGMGVVKKITGNDVKTLIIKAPHKLLRGLKRGASISIDGACLTVVGFGWRQVKFELIGETLEKTTLGKVRAGDQVNIERSFKVGDEIGGHIVSGHVEGRATIKNNQTSPGTIILQLQVPVNLRSKVTNKGFVALNGASLTVNNYNPETGEFEVHLIPETLLRTTFGQKIVGDEVNIETYNGDLLKTK